MAEENKTTAEETAEEVKETEAAEDEVTEATPETQAGSEEVEENKEKKLFGKRKKIKKMKNRRTDRSRKTPDGRVRKLQKTYRKRKSRYVCCGSQGCDRKDPSGSR